MANLASWQKITRVLAGQPFGNGANGAYSSANIPTLTKDYCSATVGTTTLTTSASTFATGDIILIHQTRGTGVGQWEINRVTVGGSTTPTLQVALQYGYTTSGGSVAQAVKIPQYTTVTVQSGTWTVPSWDGNTGGIFPFAAKNGITGVGNIDLSGTSVTGSQTGGAGKGFSGGNGRQYGGSGTTYAYQGEGSVGAGSPTDAANGSGGGGSSVSGTGDSAGGSGGHASNGTAGGASGSASGGAAGTSTGSADLTNITFGGGAGGSQEQAAYLGVGGGGGGAIMMAFVSNWGVTGSVNINGGSSTGSGNYIPASSGGAGGSGLVVCKTATLGSSLITATGGTSNSQTDGKTGSVGRIAVHHSSTVTGTTNPTFTDVSDTSLVESSGGSFLFNFL